MKTKPITIEGFRDKFCYYEKFDVCFAGPLAGVYDRKRSFYEEVGNLQLPYQKRLFIPCIDSPKKRHLEKIEEIILKIIVPASDLILCFAEQDFNSEIISLKIPPTFGRKMVDRARGLEIPVAYLIQGRVNDDYANRLFGFKDDLGLFEKIHEIVGNFYKHSKV